MHYYLNNLFSYYTYYKFIEALKSGKFVSGGISILA